MARVLLLLACCLGLGALDDLDLVRQLRDLGLPRLAQEAAERALPTLGVDERRRVALLVLLQALCLDRAGDPTLDEEERHRQLARATECQRLVRRLGGGGDDLDLAISELRWAEALLARPEQRAEAEAGLDRALMIFDRLASGLQARVGEREARLAPGRWETDAAWHRHATELARCLHHRAWARWHRAGLEVPPQRRRELLEGALDDLAGFTGGAVDDELAMRAVALSARCYAALGEQGEACALLDETLAEEPPPLLALELLVARCDLTPDGAQQPIVDRLEGALLRLGGERRAHRAARAAEARILAWCIAAAAAGDLAARRRGIRLAESLLRRDGHAFAQALGALAVLTDGGRNGGARLAPLLAAERALEAGDPASAMQGYREALQQRDLLPERGLEDLVRWKLAIACYRAGEPRSAVQALDALQAVDAALAERSRRLLPRALHAAWIAADAPWPDATGGRLIDLLQADLGQERERDLDLVCDSALRLATAGGLDRALALLDAAGQGGRLARELVLLRRTLPILRPEGLDPSQAEDLLRALMVVEPGTDLGVSSFAALSLARACEGRPALAELRDQAARLCRDLPGLDPALARQALCHQVAAALDAAAIVRLPTLAAELGAAPAADAWQADLCRRTARFLRHQAPHRARTAELRRIAVACLRRALAQAEEAGRAAEGIALRYELAEALVEADDGGGARAVLAGLPTEQRESLTGQRAAALGLEAAGDPTAALAIWRDLAGRLQPGEERWYEAKRHSAACLLAEGEADAALRLLLFTRTLHPAAANADWQALEARCRAAGAVEPTR